MKTSVTVSCVYNCSLERAFKTPMLTDVSKVHTGMGLMPAITHAGEDKDWGKVGSSKKVFAAKSLTQKGGYASADHVLERVENEHWKIQVDDFQSWMLGFYKFVGTWKTTELSENQIRIDYTYEQHFKTPFLFPFNWLFTHLFWKRYMKQVLENIRVMAEGNEPYLYE